MEFTPIQKHLKVIAWLVSAVTLANLSACAAVSSVSNFVLPSGSRLAWSDVTLVAAPDANLNTPIGVDFVFVKDVAALPAVTSMSAGKWFAAREDLLKTFPSDLRFVTFEITPGQTLKLSNAQIGTERLAGAYLFANYLTLGEHRMRVDQLEGNVVIRLGTQSFTAASIPLNQPGK